MTPLCPHCGSDDVSSIAWYYACQTCKTKRPAGGLPIAQIPSPHRHHQCRNGHRWADGSKIPVAA